MSSAVQDLLDILDLEPLEMNLFRGRSPQVGWQRVFGGQVIGQALVAAVRTVEAARPPHSMHAYFLLPGDPKVPIIYDRRVSNSIVGHLAGAINGAGIARGVSFLKDKMGQRVLPAGVDVIDDPHRRRGHRSWPYDGEGLATERLALVEDGVLKTCVLDLRSARQLKLKSTGRAARGTSSPPGPSTTNLHLSPGEDSHKALMADIVSGFYCADLIGFGVNMVTGDYSRGASGFWIENGEIAYPVSEITIAGNLSEMFKNLRAANDLEFRYATNAPTLRIDGMTVAGR